MKNDPLNNFGIRLRRLIDESPYNQSQLAKKVEVTDGAITGWINEDFFPTAKAIVKLSKVFNISTDFLLTGKKPEHPDIKNLQEIITRLTEKIKIKNIEGLDDEVSEITMLIKQTKERESPTTWQIYKEMMKALMSNNEEDYSDERFAELIAKIPRVEVRKLMQKWLEKLG